MGEEVVGRGRTPEVDGVVEVADAEVLQIVVEDEGGEEEGVGDVVGAAIKPLF